jgi:ABC-type cobalamin/Fe3+-siderophores transport system ATPase subunit
MRVKEGVEIMSVLEANALTLGYGDAIIIDELNLQIPSGEITVFVGANGCGKSTLLRSLARLLKPISGQVLLGGNAERPVDSLSGGQRQRAWIAMTLAQKTDIILLDEPTTYLDLAHQIEILDLLYELNEKEKRTIVMVLHDLNLACRYAHNIVAVRNKKVYSQGRPEDVVTSEMVKDVFRMNCDIKKDPLFGTPLCIPYGKGRRIRKIEEYDQRIFI